MIDYHLFPLTGNQPKPRAQYTTLTTEGKEHVTRLLIGPRHSLGFSRGKRLTLTRLTSQSFANRTSVHKVSSHPEKRANAINKKEERDSSPLRHNLYEFCEQNTNRSEYCHIGHIISCTLAYCNAHTPLDVYIFTIEE